MFSRLGPTRNGASRKRQKVSHENENGEDAAAPSEVADPDQGASRVTVPSQKPSSIPPTSDCCEHEQYVESIKPELEAMRQLITCKVCERFLTEPYALACGHTYCYICLDTWLVAQKKRTCPDCRAYVRQQPVPSFVVREMVIIFSKRQELLPEGDSLQEHETYAREAADKVARDKEASRNGGLFNGIFSRGPSGGVLEPIYDEEDHIYRCPLCHHEIEDGACSGCGELMDELYRLGQSDEDLDFDLDWEDDEAAAGLALGETLRREVRGRRPRARDAVRSERSGAQPRPSIPVILDDSDDTSDEDEDEDSAGDNSEEEDDEDEDQDEDDGTMDGFLVDDDAPLSDPVEVWDDEGSVHPTTNLDPHRRLQHTGQRSRSAHTRPIRRMRPIIVDDSDNDDDEGATNATLANRTRARQPIAVLDDESEGDEQLARFSSPEPAAWPRSSSGSDSELDSALDSVGDDHEAYDTDEDHERSGDESDGSDDDNTMYAYRPATHTLGRNRGVLTGSTGRRVERHQPRLQRSEPILHPFHLNSTLLAINDRVLREAGRRV